ncbi:hypothetical protein HJC23_006998 [Cyclotella cryptica]|uniref:Uncharacterized protein n=1 Tax=Cyclotella cryptica TaxID=29204 RepID=A0ABD3QMS8_9STRA|eukprot:CCRYP_004347-RB/>CCRYP_004347-RB protein AED:0.01 eAED:0.01 QI:645/1/1/1/0.66/0.5/4/218/705
MHTLVLPILILIASEASPLHRSPRQQRHIRGGLPYQTKARGQNINTPKRHRELGWLSDLLNKLSKSGKTTTTTTTTAPTTPTTTTTPRPWLTVVNNNNIIPDTDEFGERTFGSYNAPSVNSLGLVVFRARSIGGGHEEEGGGDTGLDRRYLAQAGNGPSTGVFVRDMSEEGIAANSNIIRQAGRRTMVPQPNNLDTLFIEFPSFPRISKEKSYIATRGNHGPVWEYVLVQSRVRHLEEGDSSTTRVGNTGIYVNLNPLVADSNGDATTVFTASSKLGSVGFDSTFNVNFSEMYQVPGLTNSDGTELNGVVFDVFPGSPSTDDYGNVATKGNYQKGNVSQTGVFYRNVTQVQGSSIADLSVGLGTFHVIANSETRIPPPLSAKYTKSCERYTFGSTAPPSVADGNMVFLGLDNEEDPQCGGIYLANMKGMNYPTLTPLVDLETKVPGQNDALFTTLGEVLSFDGNAVSFWGSWNNDVKEVRLCCPTSGNKDLQDYCSHLGDYDPNTGTQEGDPNTITNQIIDECPPLDDGYSRYQVKTVPVHQGFFVHDGNSIKIIHTIVADAHNDLIYWNYSGKPPAMGPQEKRGKAFRHLDENEDSEASEPPRWRSSAFTALSSKDDIMFKQTEGGLTGIWHWDGKRITQIVVDGDPCSDLDNSPDAVSLIIDSISIERDSYRSSQLVIAAACSAVVTSEEEESDWGGIYLKTF